MVALILGIPSITETHLTQFETSSKACIRCALITRFSMMAYFFNRSPSRRETSTSPVHLESPRRGSRYRAEFTDYQDFSKAGGQGSQSLWLWYIKMTTLQSTINLIALEIRPRHSLPPGQEELPSRTSCIPTRSTCWPTQAPNLESRDLTNSMDAWPTSLSPLGGSRPSFQFLTLSPQDP